MPCGLDGNSPGSRGRVGGGSGVVPRHGAAALRFGLPRHRLPRHGRMPNLLLLYPSSYPPSSWPTYVPLSPPLYGFPPCHRVLEQAGLSPPPHSSLEPNTCEYRPACLNCCIVML